MLLTGVRFPSPAPFYFIPVQRFKSESFQFSPVVVIYYPPYATAITRFPVESFSCAPEKFQQIFSWNRYCCRRIRKIHSCTCYMRPRRQSRRCRAAPSCSARRLPYRSRNACSRSNLHEADRHLRSAKGGHHGDRHGLERHANH